MAHISVERLAAGDGERDGPEHNEPSRRSGDEDADGMRGVQRREHARRFGDLEHPAYREGGEP